MPWHGNLHTIFVPQVGPGVKDLAEGDVVLPVVPLLGCWAEAAVVKAKSVVRVGKLAAGSAASSAAPDAAADAQPGELHVRVTADTVQRPASIMIMVFVY
jgi:hypothetical protein